MSRQHQYITLTEGLARTLIQEIQAVLDGEASYFHAELWTDSGLQVGLHLSGPDDVPEDGGPYHELRQISSTPVNGEERPVPGGDGQTNSCH